MLILMTDLGNNLPEVTVEIISSGIILTLLDKDYSCPSENDQLNQWNGVQSNVILRNNWG